MQTVRVSCFVLSQPSAIFNGDRHCKAMFLE